MKQLSTDAPWSGGYVRDALGVDVASDPGRSVLPVKSLVGLALRRNPKRAHLLVSLVLAKHVPTEPGIATSAGQLLGLLVRRELQDFVAGDPDAAAGALTAVIDEAAERLGRLLDGESCPDGGTTPNAERCTRLAAVAGLCELLARQHTDLPGVVTIGYAETATGLGQLVAGQLGTYYIHSTRHSSSGVEPYGAFEEMHSHATSHQLLPTSRAALNQAETVVLVDDELSTGATIINTIRELHRTAPHRRYIVASLVDLRSPADRDRLEELARELGTGISAVALAQGSIRLPETLAADAAELISSLPLPCAAVPGPGRIQTLDLHGIVPPVRSARFGVAGRPDPDQAARIADALAAALGSRAGAGARVLVLATEEFMALPLAVAARLQDQCPDADIRYSTSTRSPIAALDKPGYAIRSGIAFGSDGDAPDGPGPRFAYNFMHPEGRFDTVLVMAEPGTAPSGLLAPGRIAEAVAGSADDVRLVVLPVQPPFPTPLTGPAFGSYQPEDVEWLLKDLSSAQLEAPREEREAAIQSGRASYAESLPEEFEPSPEYGALFQAALESSAVRIAHAVGTLTEQVLKLRGNAPVLVSLARAGTPVGILMKRWAWEVHGLKLPHYAVSIVRGLGIDQSALGYLASRHRPEDVMFVDGWTGKGAIARELAAAVELFRQTDGPVFRPDLAVLADPGRSVRIFGTREDYLVPSACLNSTVSGLVSRTVFNKALIGPGDFHGAKFYSELAGSDVSRDFLVAVTAQFPGVRDEVLRAAAHAPSDIAGLPDADWSGWAAVEEISRSFGINNVNLVKPGVGETTRVLLRRVPWKVLVRPEAVPELAHVLHLAEQRGVEVLEVPDLAYSCVGLIHPLHTPGATGADGKAVIDV
ncbi:adenine/guanine phosphoribosyltransferase-like PRPP-binding protein [Arthrobacter ginsengisoli]|uniref:Adenine/guanine phosphoribosyltransferase-like PRPP-binding protein n=1 Tax=Arthrobacter ginsengisoli TaxID=1356565 RepID=A0ABU1U9E7_9MICC|nr:phosphoribosyltransferase domain-containing protein [Arthrobacter ginsengisoli]MDR7081819.1 adenine/guanine phosphoribosyltransferase-like PRPP-binding protein [Arthrobacter ginsengisoli]